MNIMVDIETLGTDSDTMILTIGAIPFTNEAKIVAPKTEWFYKKVDLNSYKKYKNDFSMDYNTLIWWLKQDDKPRYEAFIEKPRDPIDVVMEDFAKWLIKTTNNDIRIWSHGKDFDTVVLQHAFKVVSVDCPWTYWNTRDTRTVYSMAGIDMRDITIPEGFDAHNALGDCLKQIDGLNLAFLVINGKL